MMQIQKQKVNRKIFFILFAFLIVVTNCFAYKYWNIQSYVYLPFYAFFIIVIMKHQKLLHAKRNEMKFSKLVKAMIVVPFLSFISYFCNGDTGWMSHPTMVITMCGSLVFMLYFVLHALKVNEQTIISVVFVAAFCILVIQVFQQIFPSHAVFGVKTDFSQEAETLSVTDFVEVRNGFFRYRISGALFTIMAMCYAWQEVLKKHSTKNIILFLVFAFSMYLFLTRQYMIATVGMCAFSVFLIGKSSFASKLKYLVPIALFLLVLYIFSDALFGSLLEDTQNQTDNAESDIRTLAFAYYWNEIISNNITMFFGAGPNSSSAAYASQYNMFWVDIGLIGQWFAWGVGAILTYVVLLYKLFLKQKYDIASWVRFMAFITFVTSFLIYPYPGPVQFLAWSMALYVVDLHVSHSPLALK